MRDAALRIAVWTANLHPGRCAPSTPLGRRRAGADPTRVGGPERSGREGGARGRREGAIPLGSLGASDGSGGRQRRRQALGEARAADSV